MTDKEVLAARRDDNEKVAEARKTLKEIFGEDVGVIWNTHFNGDIRRHLVEDRIVFVFDNTFECGSKND